MQIIARGIQFFPMATVHKSKCNLITNHEIMARENSMLLCGTGEINLDTFLTSNVETALFTVISDYFSSPSSYHRRGQTYCHTRRKYEGKYFQSSPSNLKPFRIINVLKTALKKKVMQPQLKNNC